MIIGINGFKGAGKDTVADYLIKTYGFKKLSFAALLKDSVAALFNITHEQIEEWKNDSSMEVLIQRNLSSEIGLAKLDGKEPPLSFPHVRLTFRQFLQRYGTEAHRDIFGYEFWVDQLFNSIEPYSGDYVIPDARFENELRAIKSFHGFNWCVERLGYGGEDHASEVAPNPALIDHYIHNYGSLSFLRSETNKALKKTRKLAGDWDIVTQDLMG